MKTFILLITIVLPGDNEVQHKYGPMNENFCDKIVEQITLLNNPDIWAACFPVDK